MCVCTHVKDTRTYIHIYTVKDTYFSVISKKGKNKSEKTPLFLLSVLYVYIHSMCVLLI